MTLKGLYHARLLSIMKVRKLTSGLLARLVLVDRHYVKNSEKLSNITGIVSVMVGITKGPN